MVHSMTGFGRGTSRDPGGIVTVEIQSVNNRFLDVTVRGGREAAALERRIRERVQERLERGKVTISLAVQGSIDEAPQADVGKARAYLDALKVLQRELDLPGEVDIGLLAGWRDIIGGPVDEASEEELWERTEPALQQALAMLVEMREREGDALAADTRERLARLETALGTIGERSGGRTKAYADRLRTRIAELLEEGGLDEERLYHEVALYADRIDISEECTRLTSHLEHARTIMNGPDAAGRRLNFLLQEIHREVNTLGSKANDHGISHLVVGMKEELERMREQVQNIE